MNAIDRLKKVETVKADTKKETLPVVPNLDKKIVDEFIGLKTEFKEIEVKLSQSEETIIQTATQYLDSLPEFSKSCRVYGNNGSIRIVRADKFSVVQESGPDLVRLGFAEESRTVSIKKEVLADETLLTELLSKFSDEEISKFFDVSLKYTAKKGLDEKIPTLEGKKKKIVLESVKQAKPSVVCE